MKKSAVWETCGKEQLPLYPKTLQLSISETQKIHDFFKFCRMGMTYPAVLAQKSDLTNSLSHGFAAPAPSGREP